MSTEKFTIGRLAEAAGVNKETIRYYQRRNLLATPQKPSGGVRIYNRDTLRRLLFIKRAQTLGFTLEEIGNLIKLDEQDCDDVRAQASARRAEIREKIDTLQQMYNTLTDLIESCEEATDHCPIIETLSRSEP